MAYLFSADIDLKLILIGSLLNACVAGELKCKCLFNYPINMVHKWPLPYSPVGGRIRTCCLDEKNEFTISNK